MAESSGRRRGLGGMSEQWREAVTGWRQGSYETLPDGTPPTVGQWGDPTNWGVRRPVATADGTAVVPPYVPRDFDGRLRAAVDAGGCVLLTGERTAGRTRSAYEAVSHLTDHTLLIPRPGAGFAQLWREADRHPRCVLWLDGGLQWMWLGMDPADPAEELARFLDTPPGGHRLLMGMLSQDERALLAGSGGMALPLHTVRTATRLAGLEEDEEEGLKEYTGTLMRSSPGRAVEAALDRAVEVTVPRALSEAECDRVRGVRSWSGDDRFDRVLKNGGRYGFASCIENTDLLADRWDRARSADPAVGGAPRPRGVALVTATALVYGRGFKGAVPRELVEHLHTRFLEERPDGSGPTPEPLEEAWAWATGAVSETSPMAQPSFSSGPMAMLEALLVPFEGDGVGMSPRVLNEVWSLYPDDIPVTDEEFDRILGYASNIGSASGLGSDASARSRYDQAERAYRRAVELRAATVGPDDPVLLELRESLGSVLTSGDRHTEAVAELEEVARARSRTLGEAHEDTVSTRFFLALALHRAGRPEEALPEAEAVREARLRLLGEDHPDTVAARNQLGMTLALLGEHGRAGAEFGAAVEVLRRSAGEDAENTLWTRFRLAQSNVGLKRLSTARAQLREILDTAVRVLCEEHPLIPAVRWELGMAAANEGLPREAEAEFRALWELRRRTVGEEHPESQRARLETLIARKAAEQREGGADRTGTAAELRDIVAVLDRRPDADDSLEMRARFLLVKELSETERLAEAVSETRLLYEARTRTAGPDDPLVLADRHLLGRLLSDLGRKEEALAEWRAVYRDRARVLGADHPDTRASRYAVTSALWDTGRHEEHYAEATAARDDLIRDLGEGHPDLVAYHQDLAMTSWWLGRMDEAESGLRKALEVRRRDAGEEHGSTLAIRIRLADLHRAQERYEEAEAELRALVEDTRRVLGEEHRETLEARDKLGRTLSDTGRYEEAVPEFGAVLEVRRRLLGEEHPTTLTTREWYGHALSFKGRYEEALAEFRAVWEIRARVLGPEHEDTLRSEQRMNEALRAVAAEAADGGADSSDSGRGAEGEA